ncbi:uncharacterized protein DNG_01649 [Cephalotrichum gorgonifer]|uniref:Uncharacterized protein n=1 Tax=Cephalotrichum gorgonifer TaxID=2041049 RepID=A0AAE8MT07_9PEZI|nr:uncharacterized protein DNG_01649 [Cephalotrichum gorgonifer]
MAEALWYRKQQEETAMRIDFGILSSSLPSGGFRSRARDIREEWESHKSRVVAIEAQEMHMKREERD